MKRVRGFARQGVSTYPLFPAESFGEACQETARQLLFDVYTAHDVVLARYGGSKGTRDPGGLASAIFRPFTTIDGALAYQDGMTQAAAFMESMVSNHPFVDGNKRTGMLSTLYFLEQCGYWHNVAFLSQHEVEAMKDLTLLIAQGQMDHQRITLRLGHILRPSRNRVMRATRLMSAAFVRIADIFFPPR